MGVVLTPIVRPQPLGAAELRGRTLAIDAHGELYQFLALIRLRDGTPLKDAQGRITSHLSGLFFRTTRLITEHGVHPIFVFDGTPPPEKSAEIARRRTIREDFERARQDALERGDEAQAYAKATMTSRLTREMAGEARELLRLLGLPVVQAPSEGEAQAAHLARTGAVWAAASKDYDTLLFGAPRLLRFLTVSGKEFLPSQNRFRPLVPELLDLGQQLDYWGISHEQLIDLAILVGTDFNVGVKGIGPKKALQLVRTHGRIEEMPPEIRDAVGDVSGTRRIYLAPPVADEPTPARGEPDLDAVVRFLCEDRQFSEARVLDGLARAFPHLSRDASRDGDTPRLF